MAGAAARVKAYIAAARSWGPHPAYWDSVVAIAACFARNPLVSTSGIKRPHRGGKYRHGAKAASPCCGRPSSHRGSFG